VPTGQRPYIFLWLDAFVDHHLASLSKLEAKVMFVLYRHARKHTGKSWPAIDTICAKVGCAVPSRVRRVLRRLEAMGLVEVVQRGGGAGNSTVRRLVLPKGTLADPIQPDENEDGQRMNGDGQRAETGTLAYRGTLSEHYSKNTRAGAAQNRRRPQRSFEINPALRAPGNANDLVIHSLDDPRLGPPVPQGTFQADTPDCG
jgi:hypothetical protein